MPAIKVLLLIIAVTLAVVGNLLCIVGELLMKPYRFAIKQR